jgi:hypothetical protein
MYSGFIMLFLPMIISAWPLSLILTNAPQTFSFEDGLDNVSSVSGTPLVIASPFASGNEVVECQNGEYVRWNLAIPSKTIDLTFKICWTRLPTIANETLRVGEIWGLDAGVWQGIFITTIYCNAFGDRRWNIGTDIPSSHYNSVSNEVVYALETNRWYTLRITANLKTGTYRLYMDTLELVSITDNIVPEDVYIDFFRLGPGANGTSVFVNYYDDVTVSLLDPSPPSGQWSVRITSSHGGSTTPQGTINLNHGESLTVEATQIAGYIFKKWILDGVDYSTNSVIVLPTQIVSTQHTLHAMFISTDPDSNNWLSLQVISLFMIGGGGYLLWSTSNRHSGESLKRELLED